MLMVRRTAFAFMAKAVIVVVSAYNKGNRRYQEPVFNTVKKLLQKKKYESYREDCNRGV